MKRRFTVILGIALVVVASLGFGGVAQAMWSSNATATASVSSGTVGASVTQTTGLGGQFSATATTVGPAVMTISNTGTLPLTKFAVTAVASGTTALAGLITMQVWDNGQSTSCGTPGTAGSWSGKLNGTIAWPVPAAIAATQHENYCVTFTMAAADIAANPSGSIGTTLTFTGMDGTWAATTSPTTNFTLTTAATTNSQTVTPGQIGVSGGNDTSVTVSVPLDANGTVSNAYNPCISINVTSTDGKSVAWQVIIDTTKSPFNGITPNSGDWNWFQISPQTGTWLNPQNSAPGSTIVIGGVGNAANGFNATSVNGSAINNTPVAGTQVAVLSFCLGTSNHAPQVYGPSTGAFTVSSLKLANCNDSSQAPTLSNACVYAQVTGTYPHFYVGFTFTFDLAALINASNATADDKSHLLKDTVSGVRTSGVVTVSGPAAGTTVYTVLSDGVSPETGGITQGQVVNITLGLTNNG